MVATGFCPSNRPARNLSSRHHRALRRSNAAHVGELPQLFRRDLKRAQARGVIVMRLNEGDEVAGIAVFRAENLEALADDEVEPTDEPPPPAS